jgi:hypothetical protein
MTYEQQIVAERKAAHKTARLDKMFEGGSATCLVCGTSDMRVTRDGIRSHWSTGGHSCPGVRLGEKTIRPNFSAIRASLGLP